MSAVVLAVVVLALTWLGGLPFRLLARGHRSGDLLRMDAHVPCTARPAACGFLPEALMLVFAGRAGGRPACATLLILVAALVAASRPLPR